MFVFMPTGNVQELILQKESKAPLHESKNIRSPKALEENFYLNDLFQLSCREELWLFDDVLTQGTHFQSLS